MLRQFRAAPREQMDCCDRAAILFARRFSAGRRAVERHGNRITRNTFACTGARRVYVPASPSPRSKSEARGRIINSPLCGDHELVAASLVRSAALGEWFAGK